MTAKNIQRLPEPVKKEKKKKKIKRGHVWAESREPRAESGAPHCGRKTELCMGG
jgi:hypothetical protein